MRKLLFKKTKVKKDTIQGKKSFFDKKREYERRKESESSLEARELITSPIRAIGRATGGFLSRIMKFLGTLLLGWLMNNLPTIIAMAQELIARIQRMYELLKGFIGNVFDIVKDFGRLLGAVFQNIISLDFLDSSNRVKNAWSDLEKNFDDMGKQLDEGIRLATTSLGESIAPGGPGEIPAAGTDYTQEPGGSYSATGYATAGLSGTAQQRVGGDVEFLKEVKRVAQKYSIKEGDLLGLMASESGLDPAAGQIGGHVGLIQFSADSAKSVGTSQAALKRMTRAQQMKYVDKYFENWNLPKGANAGQLYAVVFAPAYASGDPNKVLYSSPSAEYKSNAPLDANQDGKITVSEMGARIEKKKKEFGISDNISVTEKPVTSAGASSLLGQTAEKMKGFSSAAGPDKGNNACVWAVNKVYAAAGIPTPWGSSNYVPEAEKKMIQKGYTEVSESKRQSGDIYIAYDNKTPPQAHIGIVLSNGNILSNSSSGAKFSWESPPSEYTRRYGRAGKYYRMPGTAQATPTRNAQSKLNDTASTIKPAATPATPATTTSTPTTPMIEAPAQTGPSQEQLTPEISSVPALTETYKDVQYPTAPQQQTIFIDDTQPPQQVPVPAGGSSGGSQIPTIGKNTLLNRFMRNHLLLDLAYT